MAGTLARQLSKEPDMKHDRRTAEYLMGRWNAQNNALSYEELER